MTEADFIMQRYAASHGVEFTLCRNTTSGDYLIVHPETSRTARLEASMFFALAWVGGSQLDDFVTEACDRLLVSVRRGPCRRARTRAQ